MTIGIGRRQLYRRSVVPDGGLVASSTGAAAEPQAPAGVLMNVAADKTDGQAGVAALQQGLQQLELGDDGRNLEIDIRWGSNDLDDQRKYATELVAHAPEIILASGSASVTAI